jgi:hypothetical protein
MTVNADNPALEGSAPEPDEEELSTTAPNPRESEWKMPEPIFRKTSGRLQQGFAEELETLTRERAAKITGVEPNPTPAPADASSDPKPNNPTLKLVLVILGIAGMIGFIAVFLTVVYFFFIRSNGGE